MQVKSIFPTAGGSATVATLIQKSFPAVGMLVWRIGTSGANSLRNHL
jgi:hypothetical protein